MIPYLLVGVIVLAVVLWGARGFVQANPAQLAQGLRAFLAGFSALASTGLLFTGRFGLALVAIGATFMAIRAMSRAHAGATGFGGASPGQRSSAVTTDTLSMELDHRTGELEGEVLRGRFAGRSLASLGVSDLLELLAECQREDPRSVALLETYLDRRAPDWRGGGAGGADQGAGPGAQTTMDEATAWSILGLAPGASEAEIKAAHRSLMTKLHPDHGGSSYLAAQLNQAKDYLLSRHR
jgi:DnaJ domain